MAYITGENLIAALVKAHANFSASNVSQGKWHYLDSGDSDHYAIIKHGGTEMEWISVGKVKVDHHTTIIQVWQHYTNDGDTITALHGYVANAMKQINNNQKLGDTSGIVQNAMVIELGEVEEMWSRGGGLEWLKQDVMVGWKEQVTVS